MLKENIISYNKPKSVAAEAYRALRTNLEFSMSGENAKVLLVTSSHVSEGKSSISANLATVFAMQNKKTLLIDADMRRGVQHKNFGVSNKNGLSNFLANMNIDENEFIKDTEVENLFLVTCGAVPPNPAELLSLPTMKEFIASLKKAFDIVIIDGAPVLPVTDSVILAALVDKVVIVTCSGETRNEELKSTKAMLDNAGANIAGVVLNKVDMGNKFGYSKYSKYGGKYYGAYYGNDNGSEEKSSSNLSKSPEKKADKKFKK
ncbi:MAG: CpsD/CapB family tyrosine-protein kinase [Clostridia bacterium]|nr:CpsD/CapB family tyrosine-protein kinase [Clostridia bacterium]